MSKALIDIWIGVIAFVLALIWVFVVEVRRGVASGGDRLRWNTDFPSSSLAIFTSLVVSALILYLAGAVYVAKPNPVDGATKAVVPIIVSRDVADPFRVLLFGLTSVIGIN
jgi:uncharacterized integral membrane protein